MPIPAARRMEREEGMSFMRITLVKVKRLDSIKEEGLFLGFFGWRQVGKGSREVSWPEKKRTRMVRF
tara:strand:- start:280 stop:480 length:201 start_codon:yes stop_codon:yes gene_type:complete